MGDASNKHTICIEYNGKNHYQYLKLKKGDKDVLTKLAPVGLQVDNGTGTAVIASPGKPAVIASPSKPAVIASPGKPAAAAIPSRTDGTEKTPFDASQSIEVLNKQKEVDKNQAAKKNRVYQPDAEEGNFCNRCLDENITLPQFNDINFYTNFAQKVYKKYCCKLDNYNNVRSLFNACSATILKLIKDKIVYEMFMDPSYITEITDYIKQNPKPFVEPGSVKKGGAKQNKKITGGVGDPGAALPAAAAPDAATTAAAAPAPAAAAPATTAAAVAPAVAEDDQNTSFYLKLVRLRLKREQKIREANKLGEIAQKKDTETDNDTNTKKVTDRQIVTDFIGERITEKLDDLNKLQNTKDAIVQDQVNVLDIDSFTLDVLDDVVIQNPAVGALVEEVNEVVDQNINEILDVNAYDFRTPAAQEAAAINSE